MRTSGKRSSHEKTLEKLDKSLKADALVKEDENWVDTDGWRSETKEENEKADPDWTKKWEKKQKKKLEKKLKRLMKWEKEQKKQKKKLEKKVKR